MTRFEPRSSRVESNHSANACVTAACLDKNVQRDSANACVTAACLDKNVQRVSYECKNDFKDLLQDRDIKELLLSVT